MVAPSLPLESGNRLLLTSVKEVVVLAEDKPSGRSGVVSM